MLYTITGVVTHKDGAWEGSRQFPTFKLDSTIQGIMSRSHAACLARMVVDVLAINKVTVTVLQDDDPEIPGESTERTFYFEPGANIPTPRIECARFRELDKEYETSKISPLHHDNRYGHSVNCPVAD